MDKEDSGSFGNWPAILLILGLLTGATATQVSRRGTEAAQTVTTSTSPQRPASTASRADDPTGALVAAILGRDPAPADSPGTTPPSGAAIGRESQSLDLLQQARQAARDRGSEIEVDFVIATVPDYVDSNSGWTFDPSLDALQRAAGTAGYVLDRFYLPDWQPAAQGDQASGRRHEVDPGIVIFRHLRDARVLAILLVTETPTTGLHQMAFVRAARIIKTWQGTTTYELAVLGPTFSGSSPSLRRAIETVLEQPDRRPSAVRVLSGTATSRRNQEILTFSWPERPAGTEEAPPIEVSFAATVRADDVMLHALHDHLARINPQLQHGKRVALLVESNTGYGQGFSGPLTGSRLKVPTGDTRQATPGQPPATEADESVDSFPDALRIFFPMHISRLRAEAERARDAIPLQGGPTSVTLRLQDAGPAMDVLPAMSPQSTAASVDTLVNALLSTIRREEYPAIGILSTDKRDHLFLAERIVRQVPNALLFTTEADLIYAHPGYRAFVRGAIVASSYPLFNATQSLTTPHLASAGRQQFPTMGAQGTYNALLKLLGYEGLLLDYVPPDCILQGPDGPAALVRGEDELVLDACLQPPVWISVVGQDGLWPIDSHPHLDDSNVHMDEHHGDRHEAGAQGDEELAMPELLQVEQWLNGEDSYTDQIDGRVLEAEFERARDRVARREAERHAESDTHDRESGTQHALLHVAFWIQALFAVILVAVGVHAFAYVAELVPAGPGDEASGPKRPRSTRFAHRVRTLSQTRLLRWIPRWWSAILGLHPVRRLGDRIDQVASSTLQLPGARLLHTRRGEGIHLRREHRLFLLIGFTVVWLVAVWALQLFRIWRADEVAAEAATGTLASPLIGSGLGLVRDGMVPGVQSLEFIAYVASIGILALLAVESVVTGHSRRATAPHGWIPGAVVTFVMLALAAVAGMSLATFITSEAWSHQASARLLFARTVNPGNWVSPAAPLLALTAVIYLWTVWNIRHLLMGGWTYVPESQLFRLMTGGEVRLATEVTDVLVSPWRRQNWWCLGIPFGLIVAFALYVPQWYTPDGRSFDRFLWWGSLLVLFIIAHSLAQTVHLWLLACRMLRHLFCHQIAGAFAAVAEEPLNWRLSLAPPKVIELKPMLRKARKLRYELQRVMRELPATGASSPDAAAQPLRRAGDTAGSPADAQDTGGESATCVSAALALHVRRNEVAHVVDTLRLDRSDALDEDAIAADTRTPYFESRGWSALVQLSNGLVPVLRHGFWRRDSSSDSPVLTAWYRHAEVLIGMQVAFVLRDVLARLVSGLTLTIVGALLALLCHLFYSFPGRSAMLGFDWIVLLLAFVAAAVMLIRLEKDPIISRLWSRTPGRLIWTGGFVYRLALYGVVPLVTLFAWQFPEVGGTLFAWVEPLQKAIP